MEGSPTRFKELDVEKVSKPCVCYTLGLVARQIHPRMGEALISHHAVKEGFLRGAVDQWKHQYIMLGRHGAHYKVELGCKIVAFKKR